MDDEDIEGKETGSALALPMTIAELLEIRAQIIQSWKDRNAAQDRVSEAFGRIRDKDFFLDLYSADGRHRITEPDGQYDIPAMIRSTSWRS